MSTRTTSAGAPPRFSAAESSGILNFPTVACYRAPHSCSRCDACGDDCATCEVCLFGECERCTPPDLTPRTAAMLLIACQDLAERVRQMILHSPRPVFLYHVTLAFEALFAAFERGEHPRPDSLAMQLCLHVAIDHARGLACSHGEKYVEQLPMSSYDYDFHSLYDTLLPDDGHEHLVELARMVGAPDEPLDFIALGDLLTGNALGTFFEPFELGDRVA